MDSISPRARRRAARPSPSGPAAAVALVLLLAACSSPESPESASSAPTATPVAAAPPLDECAPEYLTTVDPGVLVIGTDSLSSVPSIVAGEPPMGRGLESDVAYAIADGLGFTPERVRWEIVPLDRWHAAGERPFDFGIGQVPAEEADVVAVDLPMGSLGLVFRQGNPLVGCVEEVLGGLAGSGELQAIEDRWPTGAAPGSAE